jgi:hypothetical protein
MAYAVSILDSGVANSFSARTSWEIIAGWCCLGLRCGISGNCVVLVGLVGRVVGRVVGTVGDGDAGEDRYVTLRVGSSTPGVGACCGAILSKISAKNLIAFIISDLGCLNGVSVAC